jgi:hypothetical protein
MSLLINIYSQTVVRFDNVVQATESILYLPTS